MDDNLDEILEEEDEMGSPRRHDRRPSAGSEKCSLSHFGPRQGRLLSRLLTHTHLPGLSSLDQMHLLALADTVSTCNTDFAERFAVDSAKNPIGKESNDGTTEGEVSSGMLTSSYWFPNHTRPRRSYLIISKFQILWTIADYVSFWR